VCLSYDKLYNVRTTASPTRGDGLSVELRDALSRIAHRWRLIVGLMVLGSLIALYVSLTAPRTYTSTARVLLAVPVSTEQSTILADAARAIVTSPSIVDAAMDASQNAGGGDPDVDVEPLEGSGVIELHATHPDRETAAAVAGYLTDQLVAEGLQRGITDGSADDPVVIEPVTPAAGPDAVPVIPNVVLGALGGLALAVAIAAVLEAVSPNLVTVREVAKAVGGPPLGTLSAPFDALRPADVEPLAIRMQLAARYAGVAAIEVVSDSPSTDLAPLIDLLQDSVDFWDADNQAREHGRSLPPLEVREAGAPPDGQAPRPDAAPHRRPSPVATGATRQDAAAIDGEAPAAADPSDLTASNGRHGTRRDAGLVLIVRVPTTRDGPDLARDVLDKGDRLVLGVVTYS